jgi:hypothetical protein
MLRGLFFEGSHGACSVGIIVKYLPTEQAPWLPQKSMLHHQLFDTFFYAIGEVD